MTAGLTTEGFIVETFESLRLQVEARARVEFGPIPLDPESTIEGQWFDIIIEALIKIWEIAEVSYTTIDVDKATGAALEALCLLTGTFRRPATYSVGNVIFTGDPATPVPTGEHVSTGEGGTVTETLEDVALVAADAWAAFVVYNAGDIVTNIDQIYQRIADGTALDDGGPLLTSRAPAQILQNVESGLWTWVGEGTAYVEARARATVTGPKQIVAFAIVDVDDAIVGVNGVTNLLDFSIGELIQTDEQLRVSREAQITAPGTSTKDAIGAALLAVDEDIIQVTTFVNNTDSVNADGMPPHSVEALVRGGENQEIFDTLQANVAAGIVTTGNTAGSSTDSEGTAHVMKFSRPTQKAIYVKVTLIKDPDVYPLDGDDQVKAAIVAFGDLKDTGVDSVSSALIGAVFRAVDGILDITEMFISLVPGPTVPTTIPIALRELAVYDTTRVAVTAVNGIP